ncbi:MAG: TetR/AcrR family transcriptional regulator [Christensenellales bacterium]
MKKYVCEGQDLIREHIGKTLLDLMEKYKFDEISVVDICKAAHIGRTTYYRYYGTKNGKADALYFWLSNGWQKSGKSDLPVPQKDNEFLKYLFSIQRELLILYDNGFINLIDNLIIEVFADDKKNSCDYFKYAGAGIWIGVVRAILINRFDDDIQTIQNKIAQGLCKLL